MQKNLSIIIPAYNEQNLISDCLDSVLNQTTDLALYDVVVIDNNSTDLTAAIARNKGVRVVKEPQKGYVHAIRKGVEVSEGKILAFIDADCRAPATWVSKILKNFEEIPDIVALGGKVDYFDINPIFKQTMKLILCFSYALPGNNMAIKREALDLIGGIDPNVNLSVDYWITLKLRRVGRIGIDKSLVVFASGRRFKGALTSYLEYGANVASLRWLARPLFFDFPDVREKSELEK
jgi:glycosyltransferase involved in cell wall biosynthesis